MSILAELMAGAAEDARTRSEHLPQEELEARAHERGVPRDARAALAPSAAVKIIAEVKRASPSRGELARIPDPADQARQYQTGGASAISVLTEGRRFHGSLDDLRAVTDAVSVPVLRKDFISCEYQVWEARAAGADLVLLIVAGLEQQRLAALYELIVSLGMTALVEAHTAEEVSRAVDVGATVIGVNARDLTTFSLDRDLFSRLSDAIPAGTVKIAESAVSTPDDVAHYRSAGADVVLIGEALVTGDPVRTLQSFLAAGDTAVGVRS